MHLSFMIDVDLHNQASVAMCLVHVHQVYCLPDNYEVVDRSLDDIRYVLNPRLTREEVARLDKCVNLHVVF